MASHHARAKNTKLRAEAANRDQKKSHSVSRIRSHGCVFVATMCGRPIVEQAWRIGGQRLVRNTKMLNHNNMRSRAWPKRAIESSQRLHTYLMRLRCAALANTSVGGPLGDAINWPTWPMSKWSRTRSCRARSEQSGSRRGEPTRVHASFVCVCAAQGSGATRRRRAYGPKAL